MGAMGALFSKPQLPKPQPVVRMPDQNDPAALDARKRALAAKSATGGRASTDLSGGSNDTYINDTLGK